MNKKMEETTGFSRASSLVSGPAQDLQPRQNRFHPSHIPTHLLWSQRSGKLRKQTEQNLETSTRNTSSRTSTTTIPNVSLFSIITLLICILSITTPVSASLIYIPEQMIEPSQELEAAAGIPEPEDPRSALERLASSGPILIDLSPRPKPAGGEDEWALATIADDLERRRKRQVGGEEDASTTTTTKKASPTSTSVTEKPEKGATTTKSISPSETLAPTKSSSSALDVETDVPASSPLPQPFDNGFTDSTTESCANFMTSMLSNSTFNDCLPFSLLLKNSNSFFQASKSVTSITRTLDATCSANSTVCWKTLSLFSDSLSRDTNCGVDIANENPLILQAQLGLWAYLPLYTASCLRNPVTSSYCFADAVTNKSSPTDSYVYYLPLNATLPGGSQPTCSQCLKDTMGVFEAATGVTGSLSGGQEGKEFAALRSTYVEAAEQINIKCGPTFVNATLAEPAGNRAFSTFGAGPSSGMTGLLALGVVVLSWLL